MFPLETPRHISTVFVPLNCGQAAASLNFHWHLLHLTSWKNHQPLLASVVCKILNVEQLGIFKPADNLEYYWNAIKESKRGFSTNLFKTHVWLAVNIAAAHVLVPRWAKSLPAWLVVSILAKPAEPTQPMCFCYYDEFPPGPQVLFQILIKHLTCIVFSSSSAFFLCSQHPLNKCRSTVS